MGDSHLKSSASPCDSPFCTAQVHCRSAGFATFCLRSTERPLCPFMREKVMLVPSASFSIGHHFSARGAHVVERGFLKAPKASDLHRCKRRVGHDECSALGASQRSEEPEVLREVVRDVLLRCRPRVHLDGPGANIVDHNRCSAWSWVGGSDAAVDEDDGVVVLKALGGAFPAAFRP